MHRCPLVAVVTTEQLLAKIQERHPGIGGDDEDTEGSDEEEEPGTRRVITPVPQSTVAGAPRCGTGCRV